MSDFVNPRFADCCSEQLQDHRILLEGDSEISAPLPSRRELCTSQSIPTRVRQQSPSNITQGRATRNNFATMYGLQVTYVYKQNWTDFVAYKWR